MTPQERIYAANRANEILSNEVFQQVFEDYRTEITEKWKNTPVLNGEAAREKCWLMLQMLNKLELSIKTTLETGKLASLDLEYKQSLADRAKGLIGM